MIELQRYGVNKINNVERLFLEKLEQELLEKYAYGLRNLSLLTRMQGYCINELRWHKNAFPKSFTHFNYIDVKYYTNLMEDPDCQHMGLMLVPVSSSLW